MEAAKLLKNLTGPDESIRHKATLALGGTRRKDRAWVPDLIEAVAYGGSYSRFWATIALGGIGPPAAEAVRALLARLLAADDRLSIRQAAAGALAKIGAPAASEAIPALVQVLETEAPEFLRNDVVRSLGTLAVHDSEAIAPLIEALDDPEEGVRYNAAIQLKVLGGRAGDALPALRRLLDRENEPEDVRSQAGSAVEHRTRPDAHEWSSSITRPARARAAR